MTVEVGPKFDAEVKHWFTLGSPPGTQLETGVYRVPNERSAVRGTGKPCMAITATYRSLAPRLPVSLLRGVRGSRARCRAGREDAQRAWILFEQRCNSQGSGRVRGDPDRDAAYAAARDGARDRALAGLRRGHGARSAPVRVNATAAVVATGSSAPTRPRSRCGIDGCSGAGAGTCDVRVKYRTPAPGTHRALAGGRRRGGSPHPRAAAGLLVRRQPPACTWTATPRTGSGRGQSWDWGPEADFYFDTSGPRPTSAAGSAPAPGVEVPGPEQRTLVPVATSTPSTTAPTAPSRSSLSAASPRSCATGAASSPCTSSSAAPATRSGRSRSRSSSAATKPYALRGTLKWRAGTRPRGAVAAVLVGRSPTWDTPPADPTPTPHGDREPPGHADANRDRRRRRPRPHRPRRPLRRPRRHATATPTATPDRDATPTATATATPTATSDGLAFAVRHRHA